MDCIRPVLTCTTSFFLPRLPEANSDDEYKTMSVKTKKKKKKNEQQQQQEEEEQKLSVHQTYGWYLTDIILSHEKKDQFARMERQLAKNIDDLLPLREQDLPSIIHDFYAMAASTSVTSSNLFYRNTIINMVYTSTPLITYIHRFFRPKKRSVKRDNLILYTLTRLIERLILLTHPFDPDESQPVAMIIGQHPPLAHPFSGHHDDDDYKESIRERYGLDLADILTHFGGDPHQFLLHIILLTCLTLLDYVKCSRGSKVEDCWFWTIKDLRENTEEGDWKMFMGSAKYDLGVDRDARLVRLQTYLPDDHLPLVPVNHIGYNYDVYIHRLGESVGNGIHLAITEALYSDTTACNSALVRYPLVARYPKTALRNILDGFKIMLSMKKRIDSAYAWFVCADYVDYSIRVDFQRGGVKVNSNYIEGFHLSAYPRNTYFIRGIPYRRMKNKAAFWFILERRVSDFVFGILSSSHKTYEFPGGDKVYRLIPNTINNHSILIGGTNAWILYDGNEPYFSREYALFVGMNDCDYWTNNYIYLKVLDKKEIGWMIVRFMVLLCLDLDIDPWTFIVNRKKKSVLYCPFLFDDITYSLSTVFSENYHGALLGTRDVSWVDGSLSYDYTRVITTSKCTDMKHMWTEVASPSSYFGIGSDFDTAILCRAALGVIRANTHILYAIIRHNEQRFGMSKKPHRGCGIKKVNWRWKSDIEMYQNFVNRVCGLYDASVDLYHFFGNKK